MLDASNELHLFTLHFVYVPRINQTMHLFAQGHNRASISTERGKTPHNCGSLVLSQLQIGKLIIFGVRCVLKREGWGGRDKEFARNC